MPPPPAHVSPQHRRHLSTASATAPDPQPEPRRLPILLRRAWFGLNQAFRRRIAHTHCTPDQYTVMRNLAEVGNLGLTQSQLTRRMSSDANTITALVRRMEQLGLLSRPPDDQDRRARRLKLKPAGQRRYEELRGHALALQEAVLTALPERDRGRFLEQLELVANACRERGAS